MAIFIQSQLFTGAQSFSGLRPGADQFAPDARRGTETLAGFRQIACVLTDAWAIYPFV
jgi:hypothetical protein